MTMFSLQCVVPESIHTPPQKGLESPGGWWGGGGGASKAQKFKQLYEA